MDRPIRSVGLEHWNELHFYPRIVDEQLSWIHLFYRSVKEIEDNLLSLMDIPQSSRSIYTYEFS
jgi:hypothetical protein